MKTKGKSVNNKIGTDSENYECVQNSEGDPPCKEQKKENNAETTIVKLTQTLSEIATTIPKAIETTSLTKNQTLSEVVSTIISTISLNVKTVLFIFHFLIKHILQNYNSFYFYVLSG